MAFEDRSSPTAAASPSSENSFNSHNLPNSPESTRTSPYTCTTMPYLNEITKFTSSVLPLSMISGNDKFRSQKPEIERTFFRITSYALSSQNDETHEDRLSPMSVEDNKNENKNEEPSIQHLKYSIRNILEPDFGKKALQKTTPKKIGFKPYEEEPTGLTKKSIASYQITKTPEPSTARANSPTTSEKSVTEETGKNEENKLPTLWPAWVYCTRYSDRPSSGPRSRRTKKVNDKVTEEKRPRTAFSGAQLARLKHEFTENRYLTEKRRQQLSQELGLNEAQIKIWFQNKRAKIKKSSGHKNALAIQLMAQGLYNHSTASFDDDDMALSS